MDSRMVGRTRTCTPLTQLRNSSTCHGIVQLFGWIHALDVFEKVAEMPWTADFPKASWITFQNRGIGLLKTSGQHLSQKPPYLSFP